MSTPFEPHNPGEGQWPRPSYQTPPQGYQPPPHGYQQGPSEGWGQPLQQEPFRQQAPDKAMRPWHKKKRYVAPLALLALIFFGQALDGGGGDPTTAAPAGTATTEAAAPADAPTGKSQASQPSPSKAPASTGEAAPDPEPEPESESEPEPDSSEYGSQPKDQREFVEAVAAAQAKADASDNDLKRGSALSKRNKALCKIVGSSGKVKNWSGKINTLDANGEGKGVVSIEIGEQMHVSTWNNAFSDISDNTLIEPGALFDKFLEYSEGDIVQFSGTLLDGGDTCINDSRLTLDGKLSDPKFIFRFKAIS